MYCTGDAADDGESDFDSGRSSRHAAAVAAVAVGRRRNRRRSGYVAAVDRLLRHTVGCGGVAVDADADDAAGCGGGGRSSGSCRFPGRVRRRYSRVRCGNVHLCCCGVG